MADFVEKDDIVEEVEVDDNDAPIDDDDEGGDVIEGDQPEPSEEDVEEEKAFCTFSTHKEPVLVVAIASNADFVVSGGQDDVAHVWDPLTGNLKFSCGGHSDSVHCVAVNNTNAFIATADMNGMIQVWKSDKGEKIFDYEVDDIHWISWHPMAASVILVGTDSGAVWMFNVSDTSKIKTFQGPSTAASVGRISPDGTKVLVGYDDGSVRLWDLKTVSIIHTLKDNQGHSSTVTSMDFCAREEGSQVAASGSTDGTVQLINITSGKVISKISCGQLPKDLEADDSEDGKSVESVKFCSSLPLLLTATVTGIIEVWENSSFNRRYFFVHEGGLSKTIWHPLIPHQIISSGLDGTLSTWDGRNGQAVDNKLTHKDQVLDFDVCIVTTTPSENRSLADSDREQHVMLVTASEDSTCRIFCLASK